MSPNSEIHLLTIGQILTNDDIVILKNKNVGENIGENIGESSMAASRSRGGISKTFKIRRLSITQTQPQLRKRLKEVRRFNNPDFAKLVNPTGFDNSPFTNVCSAVSLEVVASAAFTALNTAATLAGAIDFFSKFYQYIKNIDKSFFHIMRSLVNNFKNTKVLPLEGTVVNEDDAVATWAVRACLTFELLTPGAVSSKQEFVISPIDGILGYFQNRQLPISETTFFLTKKSPSIEELMILNGTQTIGGSVTIQYTPSNGESEPLSPTGIPNLGKNLDSPLAGFSSGVEFPRPLYKRYWGPLPEQAAGELPVVYVLRVKKYRSRDSFLDADNTLIQIPEGCVCMQISVKKIKEDEPDEDKPKVPVDSPIENPQEPLAEPIPEPVRSPLPPSVKSILKKIMEGWGKTPNITPQAALALFFVLFSIILWFMKQNQEDVDIFFG